MLQDLNSTNGTTVNNAPVQEWQLADGDVIRLGHFRDRRSSALKPPRTQALGDRRGPGRPLHPKRSGTPVSCDVAEAGYGHDRRTEAVAYRV